MRKRKDTRPRIKMLRGGEFEGRGPDPLASALASLDAFRKTVQPAGSARILFEDAGYHTSDLEEIEEALTRGRIRPEQTGFWLLLRARHAPLTPAQTERYGVEFITTRERLREVGRRYPCPTAVDVGHGVFGTQGGLLFIDDGDGRAIAYAPPDLERRQLDRVSHPVPH